MTTVVCWNMAWTKAPWRRLVEMGADVALLQEVSQVPPDVADRVDIGPFDDRDAWNPQDLAREDPAQAEPPPSVAIPPQPAREPVTGSPVRPVGGRLWESDPDFPRRRWPKIAKLSDRVEVDWFRPVLPIAPMSEDTIRISDVQTIAAARVTPTDGEPSFIVVSMYAAWRFPHPSTQRRPDRPNNDNVDASAHRILSDLSTFVADADREPHRILAAGDLNIDYGADYGWRKRSDRRLWYARCRTIWDRMEALGLEYMGPWYPNGRRADTVPAHAPSDTKNVPTFYPNKRKESSPADAYNQLDHVFASSGFHESVQTRALNGVDEWGPSDHCRLLIEVGK